LLLCWWFSGLLLLLLLSKRLPLCCCSLGMYIPHSVVVLAFMELVRPTTTTTITPHQLTDPNALANILSQLIKRQQTTDANCRKIVQWSALVSAMTFSQTRRLFEEQTRLQGQLMAGRAALTALQTHVSKQDSRMSDLQREQVSLQDQLAKVQSEIQAQLNEHQDALVSFDFIFSTNSHT
jgi:hypothetical protein